MSSEPQMNFPLLVSTKNSADTRDYHCERDQGRHRRTCILLHGRVQEVAGAL